MALFRMKPHYRKRGGINYKGTATPLSVARSYSAATTIGDYALLGGGVYRAYPYPSTNIIDVYNKSLTQLNSIQLLVNVGNWAAAATDSYAFFGGGNAGVQDNSSSYYNTVYAINTSLTYTRPTSFRTSRAYLAAARAGNLVLFAGGGLYSSNTYSLASIADVDAYDNSLTRTFPSDLSPAVYKLAGTSLGEYAFFGGGFEYRINNPTRYVQIYTSSGVHMRTATLSVEVSKLAAAAVADYALFACGNYMNISGSSHVTAVNTSGTAIHCSVAQPREELAGVSINGKAIFAGGHITTTNDCADNVDLFDSSLTYSVLPPLSSGRNGLAGTSIGNYCLFAGGYTTNGNYSDTVDVYQVT